MSHSRHSALGTQHSALSLLALFGMAALPHPALAQVGVTTDIITGVVTGPDSTPIEGAIVEATSIETQVSRQRTTDPRGRFTILFPDGGGQYQLLVRYIGMAPVRLTIARQADEDRLVANVRMSGSAVELPDITVRPGPRRARPTDRAGPGATEQNLDPGLMARLPIDASDFNALATLAPGVVGIAGTDSTDAAFSVAGQRTTANDITLDGLSLGTGGVPQDAVRTTRVVTSTYDVALGKFSGGLVASTTRSGTNIPQGSFTYNLRDRSLAWGEDSPSPFAQGYTQNQLSGGLGGPLVTNRLFVFGALQGRWRDQPLPTLNSADAATLERLGVSPDSASRLLGLVAQSGIPTVSGISDIRATDNFQGFARLDWKASDAETFMLRLDGHTSSQDPTRVGALALPSTGGTRSGHGGGVMASLTSYFSGNLINEARVYLTADHSEAEGFLALPQGRVQVASNLPASNGGGGVATLSVGGNPGLPTQSDSRSVEVSDEFSWLPGATRHRIKLGMDLTGSHTAQNLGANQLGTFEFNSIDDFAAGQPSEYTRNLVPLAQAGTAWNGAAYLGDTWRTSEALQLTYGARLEGSGFAGAPAFNPAVDSLFGLRTDHIPGELHLSPRAGFTWTVGGGAAGARFGPATTIVRGGFGEFRSPTPATLYGSALAAPGLSTAETQLVCVGGAAPAPDWAGYAQDPSAIPSTCVDTAQAVTVRPVPNVTLFDPTYAAPRAWRGSLGVQQRIHGTYTVSLDASYARGVSQYGFRDLNLGSPRFTLAAEGNRPVYLPADSIVPETGALSLTASRLHPEYGQVLEVGSDLESDTRQLTLGFQGITGRGATFRLSYTYTRSRDQSSFSCCAASQGFAAGTTGGDPNTPAWAASDFERRHSFLVTVTYPVTGALEVTAIGRLNSGVPFTPLIGSDVNGDGSRNDRAFVFDPAATTDSAVAAGMRSLLANAPGGVRSCLKEQLGTIAGRNSCTGPWQSSLDLQVNWRPSWFGLDRRLTVSLVTANMLGGLDHLFHGPNDLHGWGASSAPDPTLLYVRGFDPAAEQFRYEVNGRFGSRQSAGNGIITPFQLGLQVRFTLGPDPTRDRLRSAFGSGGGRGGGGGGGPGGRGGGFGGGFLGGGGADSSDFAARFARVMPNQVSAIIALRDSLHLTDDQASRLQAVSDSLDAKNHALADTIRQEIDRAGPRPDPGVLFARLRPKLSAGRENARKALEEAKSILTEDQWRLLPEAIREPRARRGP